VTHAIGVGVVYLLAAQSRVGQRRLHLLGQMALAAWFFAQSFRRIEYIVTHEIPLGVDIRIYYRAVQEWLAGGNPWSANVVLTLQNHHASLSYAGSPATLVVLAPSALLSEDQFIAVWLGLSALSAVAIVRWLHLPLWWIFFPPTVEALYSGNPQIVVLMLLLAGAGRAGVVADAIAAALKVYAVVPMLVERRLWRVVIALGFTLATVAIAPSLWIDYLNRFTEISARLARESSGGYSAFYHPVFIIPTVTAIVLLWRRDRRAAGWLLVPALWPSTEFHYSTFAQPVMAPILAVLLAVPAHRIVPVAIIIYVAWRYAADPVRTRLAAWAAEAAPGTASSAPAP